MTLPSITETLRTQVEIALASVPHAGAIGWDVFWWKQADVTSAPPSLWLALALPNPSIGHPPIIMSIKLPTVWPDQEWVTQAVADGVRAGRAAQRAALS